MQLTAINSELAEISARRSDTDRHGAFPLAALDVLRQHGWLKLPLPVHLGGRGAGTEPSGGLLLMRLLGEIGRANLALARLFEGHVNAIKLAMRYGTPAQKTRISRDVEDGQLLAIWNTELGQGLKMEHVGSEFLLVGWKMFASGVGYIRRAVATARKPSGETVMIYLVMVPQQQPFSHASWRLQGMRGTATGEIDLTGLIVRHGDIIGSDGDYLKEPDFSAGAWRTLAAQLGAMDELYALFRADLLKSGRSEHPVQRVRLAEVAVACETARLWVTGCTYRAESNRDDPAAVIAYVNLARAAVSRAAEGIIALVQRGIGARSFLEANPVEQVARDLSFYLRQPAPDHTFDEAAGFLLRQAD